MRWYGIQGKAVGHCAICSNLRSCRVYIRRDREVILCEPCIAETNIPVRERPVSLTEARRRLGGNPYAEMGRQ